MFGARWVAYSRDRDEFELGIELPPKRVGTMLPGMHSEMIAIGDVAQWMAKRGSSRRLTPQR